MTRSKDKTTDAVEILHRRFVENDTEMARLVRQARRDADIAQQIYDLRTSAKLSPQPLIPGVAMPFWDRFILWVYLGLADTLHAGRDAVRRLFDRAFGLGRLNLAGLNDLSILLLLAGGRPGTAVHSAAEQEADRRQLQGRPQHVWRLLDQVRPPRLTELLELGRPRGLISGRILVGVLTDTPGHVLRNNLAEFLSRLFLEPPSAREAQAMQLTMRGVVRYYAIPPGTIEFLCFFYRHVFFALRMGDLVFPSAVPAGPSREWFATLPAEEQAFLQRCVLDLPQTDMLLLYLHFYARLTAEEIACVYENADPTWSPQRVVDRVESGWGVFLS